MVTETDEASRDGAACKVIIRSWFFKHLITDEMPIFNLPYQHNASLVLKVLEEYSHNASTTSTYTPEGDRRLPRPRTLSLVTYDPGTSSPDAQETPSSTPLHLYPAFQPLCS
ncbi:hypothetical protein CI238_12136 [Colletotrichum incanum]|uniref:Uncharacterized protein n=1 Tax=Colletotrichum incanum TaxID=1573173 RepID=A0A167BJY7_COLIC|nr:hypothetical protein CI238_12136 [Colletotrichum incanum]